MKDSHPVLDARRQALIANVQIAYAFAMKPIPGELQYSFTTTLLILTLFIDDVPLLVSRPKVLQSMRIHGHRVRNG